VSLDTRARERELHRLQAQHARRRRRRIEAIVEPGDATGVRLEGRLLRNFCSNDYLGLSQHPALLQAAQASMQRYGFGAGASHLVTGHCAEHHALEEELAAFTGRESALLFSSGYMANLGVISALADRHDLVLSDRWNHASLLDAARLAGARLRRYPHGDAAAAERCLAQSPRQGLLLVTDGVFSMDGDIAPLRALADIAHHRQGMLMVDDAHGFGVLGAGGGGSLEEAGLDSRAAPILMGTLGKACGSFGAFVAGEAELIEYLIQRARTYIYTTALPPAVAAASRAALLLQRREPWRRERVLALTQRFRGAALALGLPLAASRTPIQPLIVGDASEAVAMSDALMENGYWVAAIRPPTVPAGSARLRITLSASHREADVDALVETLGTLWRQRSAA
jgi:8-amino-7-oxononanoate synthase